MGGRSAWCFLCRFVSFPVSDSEPDDRDDSASDIVRAVHRRGRAYLAKKRAFRSFLSPTFSLFAFSRSKRAEDEQHLDSSVGRRSRPRAATRRRRSVAARRESGRFAHFVVPGISPTAGDENTYTPLHAAASWSHAEILRYLVQAGGNINVVDADGESPLFVVETAEMARVLIELGADPTKRNAEGNTVSFASRGDFQI